jgi:hypothetical protein
MSTNHSYDPTVLCAFINSGRIRLPLSHTRTLEVIAALERDKDWNHIAHRPDAILLKARAKILRVEINSRIPNMRLSEVDAIAAIEQMSKAEVALPQEPGSSDA